MKTKNNTCGGLYTKKVLETFKNPHNYGKIKNADGIGKVGNIVCGDVMWLYIKVERKPAFAKGFGEAREIIKNIKFETFGCVAAISTSSIITDLVKGKTIKEALKITKDNVIESLGGLPKIKYHCSVLAVDALVEAIYDYFLKNKKLIPADVEKKHNIIQKSKDIIEKRYEKWNK
ncbi:MAG: iron-sulfur cluster assembly scaffold protein [Candidatus Staskawiczbacteria bacterium RIFOXYD2_FULL_37_9]|uniref:Iron-sulfur cluster assembly scaffold protein n=1 Tax=Candidatus Staskawiczbacteria bacterium RIFOXYB1_FULL_37_44 TaxID=1802223 RepID=A0A1G2IY86_9BACT|nr:MAG: iron-sulfur cluster assembly scaffold protein [Candidatus Staskawiczbacteria bacterium RIFOXYB1_FULL_37_44]OGZ83403.1 MAG: iron-sulfur cluster assembly scaffold protein [Candidatus Staskawiczbacteria bacterium RIFOXYC1_FULL_37_52]OGZ88242.1 MAG: iron-sulfur cluster assembly scaffold protein [Candidatus Staskawiczbacteria bacterium RIFOXYC2_FULL_37_19]OGZ88806.1 MAG: iron-sulfur cluster assembly scaffold protein [Candidatus Staskawiczbacteria bacterium RIFOXYD1_FULL_37_110]OGZ94872.1 MAG